MSDQNTPTASKLLAEWNILMDLSENSNRRRYVLAQHLVLRMGEISALLDKMCEDAGISYDHDRDQFGFGNYSRPNTFEDAFATGPVKPLCKGTELHLLMEWLLIRPKP
jgi:hypothetical protein